MSYWTYVKGSITLFGKVSDEEITKALGKPVLWEDNALFFRCLDSKEAKAHGKIWDKAFKDNEKGFGIPMGSEGSVSYRIIHGKEDSDMEDTYILVDGSLRDFTSSQFDIVMNWIKSFVVKLPIGDLQLRVSMDNHWEEVMVIHDFNSIRTVLTHYGYSKGIREAKKRYNQVWKYGKKR